MARKKREWYPGAIYHITTRGNHKSDIFRDAGDYLMYMRFLQESIECFKCKLICYCLMTNHVHLIVETSDITISELMKKLNFLYSKNFNLKYDLVGHLFQGRYFSELIQTDSYLLEASRYLHLNPVKTKIVEHPEGYKWSSYRMYIGTMKEHLISSSKILSYFGDEDREKYREFVEGDMVSGTG